MMDKRLENIRDEYGITDAYGLLLLDLIDDELGMMPELVIEYFKLLKLDNTTVR